MSIKNKIWIINQYASTPETGMGGRHFYLAQELQKKECYVNVFAASYSHILSKPHNKKSLVYKEVFDGVNYISLKVFRYLGAHSKLRAINWIVFSLWILLFPLIEKKRPSVIIYSSPSIFGALSSYVIAKMLGAKFIFEVRDIWPFTLIKLGGYSPNSFVIRIMSKIETFAYKNADLVISNLPSSVDHMQEMGMDPGKFVWIPNGVSLDEVSNPEDLDDAIVALIPKNKFIVGYLGTIGKANALEYLIDAAKLLNENKLIHFVLVGNGLSLQHLKKMVNDNLLSNVTFIDPIPKRQVQSMLANFDLCYIGWLNEDLYKFGISPNKLPEYMFSSRPVLHSFSGKGDLIQVADAGLTVAAENKEEIAEGILEILNMTTNQRDALGSNGHSFVIDNLTYDSISSKLLKVLMGENNESN